MTSVSHPFFEISQVCLKLISVPLSLYISPLSGSVFADLGTLDNKGVEV